MQDADTAQDYGEQAGFAASLRSNPVPLFLIGAGIGWLLLSQARQTDSYSQATDWAERRTRALRRRARTSYEDARDRARHTYEDARERAGEAFEGARDRLSSAAEQVGLRGSGDGAAYRGDGYDYDEGERLTGRARDAVSHFGDSVREIVDEYPIATGLMGVALGMAIGASLPRTETEDEMLGGYRDDLLDRARDTLEEVRTQATGAVETGVEAVEEQVRGPAGQ